jgi:hypothetical protein
MTDLATSPMMLHDAHAWATGEGRLAQRLDSLSRDGVLLLQDRAVPPAETVIDHIALSTSGVYVIDGRRYKNTPQHLVEGGFLSARTSTVLFGSHDCSRLVRDVQDHVACVKAALAADHSWADVPVHGMLCFLDADWPLHGGAFSIDGLDVLWPDKAVERIRTHGQVSTYTITVLHKYLSDEFPAAG